MNGTEQNLITNKDVKELVGKLKKHDTKWAIDMAKKLYPEYTDTKKARTSIYNISNGVVSSQDKLQDFIAKGLELLEEYVERKNNLKEKLKQAISNS